MNFKLPFLSILILLVMIFSVQAGVWCYQESVNVATDCGGLATGTATIESGWMNPTNAIDGNWGTYSSAITNDINIYLNYTKPLNATSANWTIRLMGTTAGDLNIGNLTIPSTCFNYNSTTIMLRATYLDVIDGLNYTCMSPSGWTWMLYSISPPSNKWQFFKEEAIYWYTEDKNNITTSLSSPISNFHTSANNITFLCNATSEVSLSNITLYVWNATHLLITNLSSISGVYNTSSFNYILPREDTYYWNCIAKNIYNIGNFSTDNKTIYYSNLINCTAQANSVLNLSVYNEQAVTNNLNVNSELSVIYWPNNLSGSNITFVAKSNGTSNYLLCLNTSGKTFNYNIYYKFTPQNGFTNWYIVRNGTFSSTLQQVSLYGYNTQTGVSDLTITVRDKTGYTYYPNVIGTLQKKYLGDGVWRNVQMDQSGDNGLLTFHIVEQSERYRIVLRDIDNHIIYSTEETGFTCPCDYSYYASPYSAASLTVDFSVENTYTNSTRTVTSTFKDNDNVVRSVIWQVWPQNNSVAPICLSAAFGSSGNFSCNMGEYNGTVMIKTFVDSNIVSTEWVTVPGKTIVDYLGKNDASIWAFAILLTTTMLGFLSPGIMIITFTLGVIVTFQLMLLPPLTLTVLIVIAFLALVVSLKVKS